MWQVKKNSNLWKTFATHQIEDLHFHNGKTSELPPEDIKAISALSKTLAKYNETPASLETVMMQTAAFTLAKGSSQGGATACRGINDR